MKKKTLLLLALSAMVLGGCTKDEIYEGSINATNEISFSASTEKITKAAALSDENATSFDFGVYAYYTGQNTWANASLTEPNFMNNQLVKYDGGWTYTPMKYWPNSSGEKLSFFAYMPYDATSTVASVSTTTGLPEIVFTQTMTATGMLDLTVAKVLDQEKITSAVVLPFEHVTTRLNFSAKVDHDLVEDDNTSYNTTVFVKGLRLLGTAVNDNVQTLTDKVDANAASKLYSKATYTLSDVDGTNGAWDYSTDDLTQQAAAIELTDILALATQSAPSDYSASAIAVDQTGDATALLQSGEYLFLIPPSAEGVTASTDVVVQIDYDIVTADASVGGYTTTSTTATVSMPTGSLLEGVAYNVIISIGLDEVLLIPDPTTWDDLETDLVVTAALTVDSAEDLVTTIESAFAAGLTSLTVTYEGNEGTLSIDLSSYTVTDDNKDMDLVINLPNQQSAVEITIPDDYEGSITIYAPNASVTAETTDGTEYTDVTVTTADQTFIISAGVVVNGLTILGGNVEVYGELSGDVARGDGNQDETTTIYFKEGSTNSTTSIGENIIVDKFVIEFEPVANCYMIDINNIPDVLYISLEMVDEGWQAINTIVGSGYYGYTYNTASSEYISAETLWRTWGAGNADCNITGTPVWGGENEDELGIKLDLSQVKSVITKGENAVIGFITNRDEKLTMWSWHLWFTDYIPNTTDKTAQNGKVHEYGGDVFDTSGLYDGMVMMDRNLGATITEVTGDIAPTSDYEKYYGLYYQYGRKDPFVGYASSSWTTDQDATKMIIYDATGTATDITTQAYNSNKYNVSIAIYNPMKYFTGTGLWLYTYASSYDYWAASNDEKSPFDPSPAGWRIPIREAFADFGDNNKSSYDGRIYTTTNAYFPISGYINYTDGTMYTANSTYKSMMYNALSNTSGWGGYIEYYTTNVVYNDNYYHPYTTVGCTVRCVQDYNYSEE